MVVVVVGGGNLPQVLQPESKESDKRREAEGPVGGDRSGPPFKHLDLGREEELVREGCLVRFPGDTLRKTDGLLFWYGSFWKDDGSLWAGSWVL